MPRALWTGSISFGLVNVPVRLYSAISEHRLQFHFVHEKDESPIGYQKICKLEEKPVPDKEIVKAFEYRKGEYIHMTDKDFEAARVEGYRTIDITDFVPYEQIDPIYFAHTYYVGPQDGSEKVYSLLVKAMEDSELAAVAKFVMQVHVAAEPEEERPTDLLAALRASVEASKGGERRPSANGSRRDELEGLAKSELEKRARDADIEGRSRMSKEELIEALRTAA